MGGCLSAHAVVLPGTCNAGFWLLFLAPAQPCDLFKLLDTLLVLLRICEMLQSMEISKLQFSLQQLESSYAVRIF